MCYSVRHRDGAPRIVPCALTVPVRALGVLGTASCSATALDWWLGTPLPESRTRVVRAWGKPCNNLTTTQRASACRACVTELFIQHVTQIMSNS